MFFRRIASTLVAPMSAENFPFLQVDTTSFSYIFKKRKKNNLYRANKNCTKVKKRKSENSEKKVIQDKKEKQQSEQEKFITIDKGFRFQLSQFSSLRWAIKSKPPNPITELSTCLQNKNKFLPHMFSPLSRSIDTWSTRHQLLFVFRKDTNWKICVLYCGDFEPSWRHF